MKFKKNLLLWNYRANLNQTLLKWFLCGPLPKLCPAFKGTHPRTIPAKFGLIWFSGFRGEDLNVIFYQNMPNLHNRYISAERKIWGGMKLKKNLLLWYYWANLNQTLLKWFLCGPLPKLCPAFQSLDRKAEPPYTFLEENHPMTISSKFCSYWANGLRQEDFYGNFP
jgi:hypothetical protein